jgi:hypothetical protein
MAVIVMILVVIGFLIGAGILHVAFLAYFRFAAPPEKPSRLAAPPGEEPQAIVGDVSIRVTPRRRKTRRVPNLMEKMAIIFGAMLAQVAIGGGMAYLGLATNSLLLSLLSGLLSHIVYLLVLTALIAKVARIEFVQACTVTAFFLGIEAACGIFVGGALAGTILVMDRGEPGTSATVSADGRTRSPRADLVPGQDVRIVINDVGSGYRTHAMLILRACFADHEVPISSAAHGGQIFTVKSYQGGNFDSFKRRIQIGIVGEYQPETFSVQVELDPARDKLIKEVSDSALGGKISDPASLTKGTRVFVRCSAFTFLPATFDSYDGTQALIRFEGVPSKDATPVVVDNLQLPPATESPAPR